MVRGGPTKKVTLKKGPKETEGTTHPPGGRALQRVEKSKCKVPRFGVCPV